MLTDIGCGVIVDLLLTIVMASLWLIINFAHPVNILAFVVYKLVYNKHDSLHLGLHHCSCGVYIAVN